MLKQKKVMIVEDELHIRRLVKLILEKGGFAVHQAASGEECLQTICKSGFIPDVLLLDLMMPGVDGLQVLRSLRGDPRTRTLPIILLTALAHENVVLQGIKLGANDYIRKPFDPVELVQRLSRHAA